MRTALLDSLLPCKGVPNCDDPHKVTTLKNDEIVDVYYFDDWFSASEFLEALDRINDTTTKDLTMEEK